ncbi:MAG TPA: hypothetical protein VMZ32_12250 [Gammaproteobacteria bacterium]|nr:hypothetical protein [Gammaproteobacteria bacterium]
MSVGLLHKSCPGDEHTGIRVAGVSELDARNSPIDGNIVGAGGSRLA